MAEPPQRSVLEVRGLRRTFDPLTAPVRALRGVDLTLHAGEFLALMGPSGSGKSTLLHLVAGLDRPDRGTIALLGERLDGLEEDDVARLRRRHIGMVFQFFELLNDMSALENVAIAAVLAGERRRPAERRARDLLDVLGLGDKAAARPTVLSGGERQRLALARALANRPSVLLADEPTGSLDSTGSSEVLELLRRLHREGQAILMVSHDPQVAAVADRVVLLRDGRIDPRGEPSSTDPSLAPLVSSATPAGRRAPS